MSKKSKPQQRRQHAPEFKYEAVALADQLGVPQAAEELGLNANQLYGWRRKLKAEQEKSQSERDKDAEIARLKRQLARKEEENAILKKAAAYFAQEELK